MMQQIVQNINNFQFSILTVLFRRMFVVSLSHQLKIAMFVPVDDHRSAPLGRWSGQPPQPVRGWPFEVTVRQR